MTKEQIEAAIRILSRAQQEIVEGDIEEATAYRADINRMFGVQQLHALCDLALQALDMRPRPISEFDEFNPPNSWYLGLEDGCWYPMYFSKEGEHTLYRHEFLRMSPTMFILTPALPYRRRE